MSARQLSRVRGLLRWLKPKEVHSGDCVGADAEFLDIATALGLKTISHPPRTDALRDFGSYTVELPRDNYMARNRAIVEASDFLIAAPYEIVEVRRSGTWATIRYARSLGVPLVIYLYDGTELAK